MPDHVPTDAAFLEDRSLETSATLSTWKPTAEEEAYIFKLFRGFSLSERSNDTTSWVWEYGLDIQSKTERKWVCMPCIRGKDSRPVSYEHKGTQNAEMHLWKSHGHWDPTGRRPVPSAKKGGKRQFVSAADFWKLNRNDPNDQTMANSMIKRFDRGRFQQMVVNWVIDSNLSFLQAENERLRAIFEYLNPSVAITDSHVSRQTIRRMAFGNSTYTKTRLKQFYGGRLVKYILHLMERGPETVILYMA
jgi:hypothetical protein